MGIVLKVGDAIVKKGIIKVAVSIFFVVLVQMLLLSCNFKKQSTPQSEKKDDDKEQKGYVVFINEDIPGQNVMYYYDITNKKKEKIYEKNPFSATGYDGKIAFLTRENDKIDLFMINADGSGFAPILSNLIIKENSLCWSPDGKKIAFIGRLLTDKSDEVYYVEAGKNKSPVKITNSNLNIKSCIFTNDSKIIMYTANFGDKFDIYKFDLINKTNTQLLGSKSNNISPVISRDGVRTFYLSDEVEKDKYNLYSMDLNGGSRTAFTTEQNINENSIRVSPDSSMVAFTISNDKGIKSVHVINLNKNIEMISNNAYLSSWSNDSKNIYIASYDTKNRKIIQYSIQEKSMKDIMEIQYKLGEGSLGIKFLYFTDKL